MLNEMIESLEEFQDKFEMEPDKELWATLIEEETTEMLKEVVDVLYVIAGGYVAVRRTDADEEQLKVLENSLLTCYYDFSGVFGQPAINEAFRRVHTSNLSKLGEDGKPIRREDGKVMKGPNYQPPVLEDLV